MGKYTTVGVVGYWEDEPERLCDYLVAMEEWDEVEDAEDEEIFFYMDGRPLKVGDVISEGFVVTEIEED